jgi:hypothetical protein
MTLLKVWVEGRKKDLTQSREDAKTTKKDEW